MLRLRRFMRDPRIEITLSLITPFLAYWPPEHLGGSGVIATVATGLYISWNGPRLISAATRLQGVFFWDFFLFLIEGLVFLFTGLQAQALFARIQRPFAVRTGGVRGDRFARRDRGALRVDVSALPICRDGSFRRWRDAILRRPGNGPSSFPSPACAGSSRSPRRWRSRSRRRDGEPFPYRDAIFFLTFCVVMVTLVFQGVGVALDHSQTRSRQNRHGGNASSTAPKSCAPATPRSRRRARNSRVLARRMTSRKKR